MYIYINDEEKPPDLAFNSRESKCKQTVIPCAACQAWHVRGKLASFKIKLVHLLGHPSVFVKGLAFVNRRFFFPLVPLVWFLSMFTVKYA